MSARDEDGAVRYRVEGGVAHLTFDRPGARNAMTFAMYDALAEGLARIEADPSVRVAVLRGAGGKAFVAGTDIEQFTGFTGADGVAYEARIDAYVEGLERVRVPTVAVVEGWAVGGGLAIANACDIRVAQSGARFGVPIARTLGNCLSPANLRRLTATLGQSLGGHFAPRQGLQLVKGRDRQRQNIFQELPQLGCGVALDALLDFPQHHRRHAGIGDRHLA